jgi:DNA-binding response OmpR family regulator
MSASEPPASRLTTVVLAEDDDAFRAFLASRLREAGLRVQECRHGTELVQRMEDAFGQAGSQDVDLIISDIRMPGFTGMEVLAGMNVFSRERRCPIVLITAFGDPETHKEAKRLGAAAVIDKPFEVDELLAEVQRILDRTARWNQLWSQSR